MPAEVLSLISLELGQFSKYIIKLIFCNNISYYILRLQCCNIDDLKNMFLRFVKILNCHGDTSL